MSSHLHLSAYKPKIQKIIAEVTENRMKRIFDHVPKRKRTCHAHLRKDTEQHVASVPEDKDVILKRILSKVPRRKKTTSYEYVPPKDSPKSLEVPTAPPQPIKTPPQWLIQVMSRMNGADDPKLIIEKTLDLNDVDPRQNRLSIPINNVIQNDFLTLDESRIIDDDDITNKGNMGVGAFLVDQRTKKWIVDFKQWFMTTSSGRSYWSFVLLGEWSKVVETNGLKEGDKISLWSFRSSEILCFALVPPTSSLVDSVDK